MYRRRGLGFRISPDPTLPDRNLRLGSSHVGITHDDTSSVPSARHRRLRPRLNVCEHLRRGVLDLGNIIVYLRDLSRGTCQHVGKIVLQLSVRHPDDDSSIA